MALIDLTGQRFGLLTVVEYAKVAENAAHWLCRCDCGGESVVRGVSLRGGQTRSCGCQGHAGTKRCTKCLKLKPLSGFYRSRKSRDGRSSQCAVCSRAGALAYHRRNRPAILREFRDKRMRRRPGFDVESAEYANVIAGDPCVYCGGRAEAYDHVDPAGDSHWTNLAPVCTSCNSAKGRRTVSQFLLSKCLREERDRLTGQLRLLHPTAHRLV